MTGDMDEKIVFNWSLLKREILPCSFLVIVLFPIVFFHTETIAECTWGCIFTLIIIISAVMDYKYLLLFNKLTYTLFILGIIKNGLDGFIGAMIFGGIMLGIKILKPEGMGWGDVKFAMAIGSWIYNEELFLVIMIAFSLGAIYSLVLILIRNDYSLKQCIPFGPFLSIAGFTVYIWGEKLWL